MITLVKKQPREKVKASLGASIPQQQVSRRHFLAGSAALGAATVALRWLGETESAQALTCGGWVYNTSERWCTCGACNAGWQGRQCWYVYSRWCCEGFDCWLDYWYIAGSCLSGTCYPCGTYLGVGC